MERILFDDGVPKRRREELRTAIAAALGRVDSLFERRLPELRADQTIGVVRSSGTIVDITWRNGEPLMPDRIDYAAVVEAALWAATGAWMVTFYGCPREPDCGYVHSEE